MTQRTSKALKGLVLLPLAILPLVLAGCSGASDAGSSSKYSYDSATADPTEVSTMGDQLSAVEKPKSGVKLGVVLKSLTNEYWQEVERGMQEAAEFYGVELTVQAASSETSQSQQLSIAQTMVTQDFDAYLVSPESTANLTPAIKQMQEKGVPIVNVEDARVKATTFVGPESLIEGGSAGDFLSEKLPSGAKVAQIEGAAGSDAAKLRTQGFKDAIKKAGSLNLIASVPGDWDARKAYDAATTLLQQNPDLAGFYANNDTMALGVVKAVADAGKAGTVLVVGTDGVPSAIKAIEDGTLAATTTPQPFSQGYWSVQAALALLQGDTLPPFIATPAVVIDADNVAASYGPDGLQTEIPAH
jgi:ribose transport system substrate-binding protein